MSDKYSLDINDWKKWAFNFLRFVVIPTVIAFLYALQGGVSMEVAWGVAYGTLYTSIIDLGRKFMAGDVK